MAMRRLLRSGIEKALIAGAFLDSAALGSTYQIQQRWQMVPTTSVPIKSYQKKLLDCLKVEIEHEKENYETDQIVKDGPPNGFQLLEMEDSFIILHKKRLNEDITIKASFVEQPVPEKEDPEDPESAKDPPKVPVHNRHRDLFDHPQLGVKRNKGYAIVRDPFKASVKYVLPKWMVVGQEGKYHHTFGWKLDEEPPKDPYFDPPILTVSQTIMMTAYIKKEGFDEQLVLLIQTDGGYVSINHAGMEKPDNSDSDLSYTGPAFGELDEVLQDTFNKWAEERGIDDLLGDYMVQKIHDVEQMHYQDWLQKTQSFISME